MEATIGARAIPFLLEFLIQCLILLSNLETLQYHLTHMEYVSEIEAVTLTAASKTTYFQGVYTLEKHLAYQLQQCMGQRSGVAPAAILGTLIRSPNRCLLQPSEQNISNHCGTLTYVLHSKYQQEMLQLTVQESSLDAVSFYYNYHPPVITISLRSCPWGFTLQYDPLYCDCDPPYCDCDPLLVRHN